MDTRNGIIYSPEEYKIIQERYDSEKEHDDEATEFINHLKPCNISPTPVQMRRVPPKVGRNEQCPCGSGKKFKKCCLNEPPKGADDE